MYLLYVSQKEEIYFETFFRKETSVSLYIFLQYLKKYYVAVLNIYFKKAFNPFTMDVTSFKGSID